MRPPLLLALVLAACSPTEPAKPSEPTAPKIVEVDAGNFHTCIRIDDGTVECWGQCARQCGVRQSGATERLAVGGLSNAVELAVGDAHACARLADGTVACWGSNYGGLLGRREPEDSAMPLVVPDVKDVVEIAIDGGLTCARHGDGGVTCWGQAPRDYDQREAAARERLPRRVAGLADAQAISMEGASACARGSSGAWSCWSWNAVAPDYSFRIDNVHADARGPDVVQSTRGTCGCDLGKDGVVHCIGTGILSAQLADGSSPPVQLHECPADGLANVRALGDSCAVMIDGTLQCWGETYVGTYQDLRKPTAIEGITDVAMLAQGARHTCVLTNAGALVCFGDDTQGQVDGHATAQAVWPPKRIER